MDQQFREIYDEQFAEAYFYERFSMNQYADKIRRGSFYLKEELIEELIFPLKF
jgi:hypothetical protein